MLRRLLISISLFCTPAAFAAEAKQAESKPPIQEGELVYLGQDNQKFLSVYQTENKKADIAIILFHDQLGSPNEPNFIGPIRRSLAKLQWPTFSMGVTQDNKENLNRLQLTEAHLKKQGIKKFIFLGYGFGSEVITAYLQDKSLDDLLAIVFVSAYPTQIPDETVKKITEKEIPILDITAMSDFDIAKEAAKNRHSLSQALPSERYRHVLVTGADHYYNQLDTSLAKTIHSWLRRQSW